MVFPSVGQRIRNIHSQLTSLGKKDPLNPLSILVIICLDLILLSLIFMGLSDHTAQLVSPDEYVPAYCQELTVTKTWTETAKIDYLQKNVAYGQFEGSDGPLVVAEMQADCQKITAALHQLRLNHPLLNLLDAQFAPASPKSPSSAEASRAILTDPEVVDFWRMLDSGSPPMKTQIRRDLNQFSFTYEFKALGFQLIFLLPLFLGAYFWNAWSLKRESPLQVLISTHLLVISTVPIAYRALALLIQILPDTFLRTLIKSLRHLHIVAIWHYLVIGAIIGIALVLIIIIQRKGLHRKKLTERRLAQGRCLDCGRPALNRQEAFCAFCGSPQQSACTHCSSSIPLGCSYCPKCGCPQAD